LPALNVADFDAAVDPSTDKRDDSPL